MLGVGSLFKIISDPALMQHTHAMMAAVIEGANANRRIEAKLDRLLKALGNDISDINARFPAQFQPGPLHPGPTLPALPYADGAAGIGGYPPTTGAVDDGSREPAASLADARGHPRNAGVGDPAAIVSREPRQ
jgi:hypothetical protein